MPPKRGVPQRRRTTGVKAREAPPSVEFETVTVEIEDLSTFNPTINMIIYGPSGHGKTTLAGGAPRATFIATETGTISAARAGSQARLIQAPTWEHVVAAKTLCDRQMGPDDWVILDSLTKAQMLMIRAILRNIHAENEARDLDIPAIQDHQKWQNYFKRWVDEFIAAQYNTIMICGEMIKTDQDGEDIVLPEILGKDYEICNYVRAATDINLYFGITSKTESGEPIRRALAQPFPPFVAAKDRYSVLGRWQDVPDGDYTAMAEFINMIETSDGEVDS
jgi:AAA domain